MRRTMLVVDDHKAWRQLLKKLLSGTGYVVHTAATCAEALRLAALCEPDCILLDFNLTDGDAVSVCAALPSNKNGGKAPVIIFSSDPGAETRAYAECAARRFLLKGAQPLAGLPAIIESVLPPRLPGFLPTWGSQK